MIYAKTNNYKIDNHSKEAESIIEERHLLPPVECLDTSCISSASGACTLLVIYTEKGGTK